MGTSSLFSAGSASTEPPYRFMRLTSVAVCLVCVFGPLSLAAEPKSPPSTPQQADFFEKSIRPVLVEQCQKCHGAKKQEGGLRLDSGQAVQKGGDNGPVIKSGDPDKSPLIQ